MTYLSRRQILSGAAAAGAAAMLGAQPSAEAVFNLCGPHKPCDLIIGDTFDAVFDRMTAADIRASWIASGLVPTSFGLPPLSDTYWEVKWHPIENLGKRQ